MAEIDNIFLINMDRSTDRLASAMDRIRSFGMPQPIHRLSAVDGSHYHNPTTLRPGHFGCLSSHMMLWKHVAQSESGRMSLIFEDDVGYEENTNIVGFAEKIEAMVNTLPASIEMVNLTAGMNKVFHLNPILRRLKPIYKVVSRFGELEVRKCSPIFPWSTHLMAYLISPKAAGILFSYGQFALKYDRYMPGSNNVDVLVCKTHVATLAGALVNVFDHGAPYSALDLVDRIDREPDGEKQHVDLQNFFSPEDRLSRIF